MAEVRRLEQLVHSENACALPGCTIVYDKFVPILQRAMSRGYVRDVFGNFVLEGLKNGFALGVLPGSLRGRRKFRNYPPAYQARESVTAAINARVAAKKTLRIGKWGDVKDAFNLYFTDWFIFPMGAVAKPHQPSVMRPTSDHTRTGFNAATVMGILQHSLCVHTQNTYNQGGTSGVAGVALTGMVGGHSGRQAMPRRQACRAAEDCAADRGAAEGPPPIVSVAHGTQPAVWQSDSAFGQWKTRTGRMFARWGSSLRKKVGYLYVPVPYIDVWVLVEG